MNLKDARKTTSMVKGEKENRYRRIERLFPLFMTLLIIAVPLSIILAVSIGPVRIPFFESYHILFYKLTGIGAVPPDATYEAIIWVVRLPRILLAALIGAGLALCGTIMQSSVQNPLADPYILGTSSGASLGATFVIIMGLGGVTWVQHIGIATGAFIGALAASMLVLVLASTGSKMTSVKLVLSGVVLNMICGSFSSLIVYLKPNAIGQQSVAFWSMGSLVSARWQSFGFLPLIIIAVTIFFLTQSRIMNTMMLGDETAVTLGIDTSRYRLIYMILAALLTGFIVAQCGIIGYVGLIIPHLARGIVGTDHRKMLPFAVCLGAVFLIWVDLVARTLVHGSELPLGLITSSIGAPLLLYRIVKQNFGSTNKI
jgi:iron complex transport system permease protein